MNIFLTDKAVDFLKSQLKDNDVYSLSVKKSGCAGFMYDFKKIKTEKETHVFKSIPFSLNEKDHDLINDVVIDYKKDGLNNKIVFENPNSSHECGCGESFTVNR